MNVRKNLTIWHTTSEKQMISNMPCNTQEYPEIPESKKDTRKYPVVHFNTPTQPGTRYFFKYPNRPDIEKPYPLGTVYDTMQNRRIEVVSLLLLVLLCLKLMLEISSGYNCDCNLWPATFPSHISPPSDCLTWLEVSWLRQFPSSCSFVALRYNDDAKCQICS